MAKRSHVRAVGAVVIASLLGLGGFATAWATGGFDDEDPASYTYDPVLGRTVPTEGLTILREIEVLPDAPEEGAGTVDPDEGLDDPSLTPEEIAEADAGPQPHPPRIETVGSDPNERLSIFRRGDPVNPTSVYSVRGATSGTQVWAGRAVESSTAGGFVQVSYGVGPEFPHRTVTTVAGTGAITLTGFSGDQIFFNSESGSAGTYSLTTRQATLYTVSTLYLHGSGATANPPTLSLDAVAPTASTDKYRDSTAVNFAGGNPWKDVGTWNAAPSAGSQSVIELGDVHAWLGLKNSDDQGTQFDLRAEIYVNDTLRASGTTRCITGLTRNASLAKEATVAFGSFPEFALAASDVLKLKVLTRIGTNPDDSKCSGPGGSHNNAVGLRVYFDSVTRPARFGETGTP
jgi:hypothetical protein